MTRIDEFETKMDALLEEFSDVEVWQLEESLEYYVAHLSRKK